MAISDQTVESLRLQGIRAKREGKHAVVEADLLLALLDELPSREKYARAIATSITQGAKLQRIRWRMSRLSSWRRSALRLLAPQVEDEIHTIAPYGR